MDRFCRIGRAEPPNPAGITAHTTHNNTDRVLWNGPPLLQQRYAGWATEGEE
jgi:hypothetical protein